ncbi:MAG: anthranilate synthase component I, partial [Brevundimonas sp.]|nr:anthranilate synthase component I [Brevundimonas sp.]
MSQGAASPSPDDFARDWSEGRAQVVFRRLIDDLETPVSACLKLGRGEPYAFLFESVEGGAWRGRYSILTLAPDLVWRCRGDKAEVARGDDIAADRFTAEPDGAVASMKRLVDDARIPLPEGLPPMAAGVFGVFGYDLVRLFEPIGAANPDPLDLPDAVLTRPSIVA